MRNPCCSVPGVEKEHAVTRECCEWRRRRFCRGFVRHRRVWCCPSLEGRRQGWQRFCCASDHAAKRSACSSSRSRPLLLLRQAAARISLKRTAHQAGSTVPAALEVPPRSRAPPPPARDTLCMMWLRDWISEMTPSMMMLTWPRQRRAGWLPKPKNVATTARQKWKSNALQQRKRITKTDGKAEGSAGRRAGAHGHRHSRRRRIELGEAVAAANGHRGRRESDAWFSCCAPPTFPITAFQWQPSPFESRKCRPVGATFTSGV